MNGTDRATPAYIGVDAALILGSSEGIWLGDTWQEIQVWEDKDDGDLDKLALIGMHIFDDEYILPNLISTNPYTSEYDIDVDLVQALLCDFRKAIIEKFYEVENE